ncbi:MRN complex-interacting protein isoform X5 [Talpa occidentalis]|uniref:MRN complex-interacting protein isoform X5 n=1 Tax=Talpa occidentalis TaxID=50954 RepID=UPI0018903058|nr:MRN complex-interacting protein isoform X5 [Talpa occidentalis]
MAPPQQARVLRCCYCRLFQVHQVKKSLKWTCKACGEKQSFLRAYGEGSAADCRCHVQKLNLLQGQSSEMSLSLSLRSLEEPGKADDKENAGPRQAEHASLQEKPPPVENRWLKYLERDAKEPGLEGVCFSRQSSSETGNPDPPFNKDLPRKRARLSWQRAKKAVVVKTGTTGDNHHGLPSRSAQLPSGDDFFCHLKTVPVYTRTPRHSRREHSGWLNKRPQDPITSVKGT